MQIESMHGWSSRNLDGPVTVKVHTFRLNSGIMVPEVDDWFSAPFGIQSIDLTSRLGRKMKVYFQLAVSSDHMEPATTEWLIFRKHGVLIHSIGDSEDDADDVKSVVGK